jgi:hypothetical protein
MTTRSGPAHDDDHGMDAGIWRYTVRVRGNAGRYLWGSAGLTKDQTFPQALLLEIENDQFGTPIDLTTAQANGTQTALGSLQPGERVTIAVQGFSGVFATCALESTVRCGVRR